LRLEELEARALLSADGLEGWAAHPNLNVLPAAAAGNAPYSPYQIRHAYGFDKLALDGAGQTIAIVDAYDEPNILSDLKQFDKAFGLPDPGPSTFTFTKVTPQGAPPLDSTWAGEIALDVEWAHAIAPRANILLVEAKSSSNNDLLAAVDYARHYPGVVAVSMSWGGPEFSTEAGFDHFFTTPAGHQGVAFVASTGDDGTRNGPEWPSVSPNVLAVGGTTLKLTTQNTYGSETGWGYSTGGYSHYAIEPSYQQVAQSSGVRTAPDVAYNANPNTGYYVYVSVPQSGHTGWFTLGGTSAGAPQWAALFALADQWLARAGKGSLANAQAAVYKLPAADFHDIASGSNGLAIHSGYDLVTGRGSPCADKVITDLLTQAPHFAVLGGGTVSPHSMSAASSSIAQTALVNDAIGTFDPVAGMESLVDRPVAVAPAIQPQVATAFASPPAVPVSENGNVHGTTNLLASNVMKGLRRQANGPSDSDNVFRDLVEPLGDQEQG
jgi:subtilase family serine protease